jgi:hypothetical protein
MKNKFAFAVTFLIAMGLILYGCTMDKEPEQLPAPELSVNKRSGNWQANWYEVDHATGYLLEWNNNSAYYTYGWNGVTVPSSRTYFDFTGSDELEAGTWYFRVKAKASPGGRYSSSEWSSVLTKKIN